MKLIKTYWKSLLMALVILHLSLLKTPSVPTVLIDIPHLDKWVHFGMYFILCLLIIVDNKHYNYKKNSLIAFIISTLYGGLMEYLQYYFPPRINSWADFFANCSGAIIACTIFILIQYFYERKKTNLPDRPHPT